MQMRNYLLLTLFVLHGCGSLEATTTYTSKTIMIHTQAQTVSVVAEVADTDSKRMLGLMNRESLDSDKGMLFVFDTEDEHSFWMKNTLISLDLIFINNDKKIVYIEESATPLSESRIQASENSRYVLEVSGGYCHEHNVEVGDIVSF